MNPFDNKTLSPMLIGSVGAPFNNPDYIYELKWDGERCLAYLDKSSTELRNKRNFKMLPKVPELSSIHKQVKKTCVLDGELMILKEGKPDFYEIQKRSLMSNQFKISLLSKKYPATFIAFDILYYDNKDLTFMPLMERKKYLEKAFRESDRLAVSRYIEENGIGLYTIAEQQDLEGIVAKKRSSIYIPGKRSKDWIKIKNLKDADFVVCGYIFKENHVINLVLGQYEEKRFVYKGHVTLGVGGESFRIIEAQRRLSSPPFAVPSGNEEAIWIQPDLVCTVKFMDYTPSRGMRQPVFKGLRDDKKPEDCVADPGVGV